MRKENKFSLPAIVSAVVLLLVLAGCNAVVTKSDDNGKQEKKVEISTPLGGLQVRKDVDPKELGLTPYPNARLLPEEQGSGDSSANVNISTPFFALKVIAAKYESDDPPEKIIDFYRKDMTRYGKVVQCKGSGHNGSQAGSGKDDDIKLTLTCDDSGSEDKNITLKAGQGESQHMVEIEPQSKGAHIGLVYIQMRGKAESM
ncbi:MAG TPA: hypothetical protein VFA71_07735 [Terriglobales bacterium]|nr:hypothetical protein [Terriglobales bacterium]